jgi:hypothetical protein
MNYTTYSTSEALASGDESGECTKYYVVCVLCEDPG